MVAAQTRCLNRVLPTQMARQALVDTLQGRLATDDGEPADAVTEKSPYSRWQQRYFHDTALRMLGVTANRPWRFLDSVRSSREAACGWLNSLDWEQPWQTSNLVMFILAGLLREWEDEHNSKSRTAVSWILDWHDQTQNSRVGFWGKGLKARAHHGLFGAYHQYLFYFYLERPLPCMEQIIDSTLRMQQRDGLWAPQMGGGGCHDMDAVVTLAGCSLRTEYRRAEVESALRRAGEAILRLQTSEGGFLWRTHEWGLRPTDFLAGLWRGLRHRDFALAVVDSGMRIKGWRRERRCAHPNHEHWTDRDVPVGEADLFSTFARLDALRAIGLVLDEYADWAAAVQPLPHPGLGCDITVKTGG